MTVRLNCIHCDRTFEKWQSRISHEFRAHTEKGRRHTPNKGKTGRTGSIPWNKGLTKDDHPKLRELSEKIKALPFRPTSEETRLKISSSMKKAHAEGRAWNIGMSRWNNEPSYPEKFFMKVIENEFLDKDYVREMPFGKFSLDFAWPHRKTVVEIDGNQHDRFAEQKRRDREKDALLEKNGWRLKRVRWAELFANTKSLLQEINEFVHADQEVPGPS